jgi:hypothetical protein
VDRQVLAIVVTVMIPGTFDRKAIEALGLVVVLGVVGWPVKLYCCPLFYLRQHFGADLWIQSHLNQVQYPSVLRY